MEALNQILSKKTKNIREKNDQLQKEVKKIIENKSNASRIVK
jgi:hypothetical protein